MPMMLSLAVTQMRMSPAEAITAATINAAASLNRVDKIGSLEVGKVGEFRDLRLRRLSRACLLVWNFAGARCCGEGRFCFKERRFPNRRRVREQSFALLLMITRSTFVSGVILSRGDGEGSRARSHLYRIWVTNNQVGGPSA